LAYDVGLAWSFVGPGEDGTLLVEQSFGRNVEDTLMQKRKVFERSYGQYLDGRLVEYSSEG
jgi:hypothetical protein